MLRTTNEHFKPKAPLEPEAGPERKKPGFGLRYPGPYCKHYVRPLRFALLCRVLLSSVLWALIEAMVRAYTYVCHRGSLHFTSTTPSKRQGTF
jgi:hypothetical protein